MQDITYYGILSGAFYVISNALFFLSLDLLDEVAVPTGVTCGMTMVVSFAFGAYTEGVSGSMFVAVGAIALMCCAVWGITRMQIEDARCAPRVAASCAALRDLKWPAAALRVCAPAAFAWSRCTCCIAVKVSP